MPDKESCEKRRILNWDAYNPHVKGFAHLIADRMKVDLDENGVFPASTTHKQVRKFVRVLSGSGIEGIKFHNPVV
jgi:hypothetical protein